MCPAGITQYQPARYLRTQQTAESYSAPDGEMFFNPPPLGATVMQGAPDARSLQEEQLRWDLLSQGQGLFLKQTHQSTNLR